MLLQRLTRSSSAWRSVSECALTPRVSHAAIRQRQNLHTLPTLDFHDEYIQGGVANLYTAEGYDIAWTQYQSLMVKRLNDITAGFDAEHAPMKQLVLQYARNPATAPLFNHASMAHNNNFFFGALSPAPAKLANYSALETSLKNAFGSIETLQKTMLTTADTMFGPGFVWLVATKAGNNRNLTWRILTTYLAGTPYAEAGYRQQAKDMNVANTAGAFGAASPAGRRDAALPPGAAYVEPVLCVSTWEHAYLRDYGVAGKRAYLEAWWKAINWGTVDTRAPANIKDQTLGQFIG